MSESLVPLDLANKFAAYLQTAKPFTLSDLETVAKDAGETWRHAHSQLEIWRRGGKVVAAQSGGGRGRVTKWKRKDP